MALRTRRAAPFSRSADVDFEIRTVLGTAVGGGADPGEVTPRSRASGRTTTPGGSPGLKPASTTMMLNGPLVVPGAHQLLDLAAYVPD